MRKTLAAVALTAALTGGSTAVATTVFAAPASAAPPVAQTEGADVDGDDGDKTGLWGLLGLLGLAGLIKKKEHHDTTSHR
jgi:MYXO-CTERM domain-containing protein